MIARFLTPNPTNHKLNSQRRWHARRKLGLDVLGVFSELFPAVFAPPNFRPLKLKIHLDLIERAPVTAEEVDAALSIHCLALPYLRAQIEGASASTSTATRAASSPLRRR